MIGLDTTILVRYIAQDDAKQAERATAIIENDLSNDQLGFVSSVVLVELCWTLKRSYQVGPEAMVAVLEGLLKSVELSFEHRDEAWKALKLMRTKNVDFADALIGIVHEKYGCEVTLTFDKKAAKLDTFMLA